MPHPVVQAEPTEREALLDALQAYMAQFGQALEAHGIPFGPAQMEADAKARAAIAAVTGGVE